MKIAGSVALVTGASGGIGSAKGVPGQNVNPVAPEIDGCAIANQPGVKMSDPNVRYPVSRRELIIGASALAAKLGRP